ncbi:hypothetical protein PIB30_033682 [Stylosanthes scabra]|uniref:RING-type E3 ubiquitin transferase n=1 Tax=Stylosanthes scabra TaxID=79078 RepID=A0ABU6VBG1_9FABA|nr:hypothetical protein [Stylosanthes scabra]
MSTKSDSSNMLGESDAVVISGKIMIAVVVLLSLFFVFVFMLHICSKFSMWRVQQETSIPSPHGRRRRRHHRHFVFASGEDPIIQGNKNVGLDPSILKSIPVLVFQPHESKDDLECAVCISELVEGEKFRTLPHCNHGFHVDCIDMWFQSHSTCPLCRTLVTNSTPSVRENVSENSESPSEAENSARVNSNDESSNFPTHVLVWGDQTQFFHTTEDPHCSSSSSSSSGSCSSSSESGGDSISSSSNGRTNGVLVIDIPNDEVTPEEDNEMKSSPMVARLRSIKKLLSRDKKSTSPCSPNSVDVEQAQS